MKLRAVLFDATGTLMETARPVGEVYAERAREQGVSLSPARLEDAFRRILAQAPPLLFPDAAPERIRDLEAGWWRSVVRSTFLAADGTARFRDFDGFFAGLYGHYASAAAWRARPGAREALLRLRAQGLATGVVSNFDGRLPGILAGLGLAELLAVVMLPGEARAAKPDPRIFALALARLGVPPAAAVFVGDDRARDLEGARVAGLSAIDASGLATLDGLPALLMGMEQKEPA
ncbi:MAG TPA: HAD-IA family hydrolase [Myxococcota bacterium]|jgi:putative hydrolase of the HAD superfamily